MASFIEVESIGVYAGSDSIGARGLSVVAGIEGVTDARVLMEDGMRATIVYEWDGEGEFDRIDDELSPVGLKKVSGGFFI